MQFIGKIPRTSLALHTQTVSVQSRGHHFLSDLPRIQAEKDAKKQNSAICHASHFSSFASEASYSNQVVDTPRSHVLVFRNLIKLTEKEKSYEKGIQHLFDENCGPYARELLILSLNSRVEKGDPIASTLLIRLARDEELPLPPDTRAELVKLVEKFNSGFKFVGLDRGGLDDLDLHGLYFEKKSNYIPNGYGYIKVQSPQGQSSTVASVVSEKNISSPEIQISEKQIQARLQLGKPNPFDKGTDEFENGSNRQDPPDENNHRQISNKPTKSGVNSLALNAEDTALPTNHFHGVNTRGDHTI
jgi:hypothetical protein